MSDNIINKNIHIINYIKAFAIVMVIMTHFHFSTQVKSTPFYVYIVNMAVPIFITITGLNFSASYLRRNFNNILDFYNIRFLLGKFLRLVLPFTIILGLEYLYIPKMKYASLFNNFIIGGVGLGSYYFPVMLQLILVLPILHLIVKKYKESGLILVFIITFLSEVLFYSIYINPFIYRLLVFRYLFHAALGVYLCLFEKRINNNTLIISFIIGMNFLNLYMVFGNNPYMMYPFKMWTMTSLFTAFYIFPVVVFCYRKYKNLQLKKPNLYDVIGQASWHIFLVQMLYFAVFYSKLKVLNMPALIILTYAICISVGVIFFCAERKILKLLKQSIAKFIK